MPEAAASHTLEHARLQAARGVTKAEHTLKVNATLVVSESPRVIKTLEGLIDFLTGCSDLFVSRHGLGVDMPRRAYPGCWVLQPYAVRGSTPMASWPQLYGAEAATLCTRGCNPM